MSHLKIAVSIIRGVQNVSVHLMICTVIVRCTILFDHSVYSECVFVYVFSLSCTVRNAPAPYYIFFCGLSSATLNFPRYLIIVTIFGKKKLLYIKCMLLFPLQLLSELFLILRRIQRSIVIHLHRSSCKVHVILVIFY